MTIRQTVALYLIENTPESIRNLRHMIKSDSWAYIIYDDEKDKVRIEKYLDGVMPQRMMKTFEKMIQNDERLMRKFKERKKVHDNIHTLVPLIDTLEKAHQTFEKKYRNKEFVLKPILKTEARRISIARWSVAASILLLMGLGLFYKLSAEKQFSNDELFAEYYEPLKFNKGTDVFTANSNQFIAAKEKYKERDYESAYVMFKGLPDLIDIQYEKNFYLGLILIEMAEYSKATSFLELSVKNNFEFLPQAYWYLGLCYLKTGQHEKAIESLEYLVSGSSYKEKEAKKILKILK